MSVKNNQYSIHKFQRLRVALAKLKTKQQLANVSITTGAFYSELIGSRLQKESILGLRDE